MSNLNVKHYLGIYQARLEMQEQGITNPPDEIKRLTREIVYKLSEMDHNEEITVKNGSLIDSNGNVIISLPPVNEN